ncbi:MAG: FHA domain-containing protein [Burkholderiales bacterium]
MNPELPGNQSILNALSSKTVLKPMTEEAARAVPVSLISDGLIAISRFPLRVGRESRFTFVNGEFRRKERPRLGNQEPNNDLYLLDTIQPLHISREHFQIDRTLDGYVIVDRGSACGTIAGDVEVGGKDSGGSMPIKDGDIVIVGTSNSPYIYSFVVMNTN